MLAEQAVTRIDLHLRFRGADYSVDLECADGLRDVRYDSAELAFLGDEDDESSFSLLFDVGREDERRFGRLPRVELGFHEGRVTVMLLSRPTGESSTAGSNLCVKLPPDPVCTPGAPRPRTAPVASLVDELRGFPTPLPPGAGPGDETEKRRARVYEQLLALEQEAVAALAHALEDPDVAMRRNVALAFGVLGGGWWPFECGQKKADISAALPALVRALGDTDSSVRAWAAQAIGVIGADADSAVPMLTALLDHDDEGTRNSACIALRGIGPAARAALRSALSDPSSHVRRSAALAIERIEG